MAKPNIAVELTGHSARVWAHPRVSHLWPAAHRWRSMPQKGISYTLYECLFAGHRERKMMRTYRALLRRDRLEWLGEAPECQTDSPLSVQVTLVEQEPLSEDQARGPAMAATLRTDTRHNLVDHDKFAP